jgi:hypothetical protein
MLRLLGIPISDDDLLRRVATLELDEGDQPLAARPPSGRRATTSSTRSRSSADSKNAILAVRTRP